MVSHKDFCSVPRSDVEKVKNSVEARYSTVLRTFALCHEVAWKRQKFGRGPVEQRVEDFCSVSRGGVRKNKIRSRTDRAVCRGLLLSATWWRKKEKIGYGPIKWGDGCHVVALKKKSSESAVCRGLLPCATRWL